jgi:hypothetical protein
MTFNVLVVVLLTSFLLRGSRGYSLAIADVKISGNSCSKSLADSNGFFCQPDAMWMLRKGNVRTMYQANLHLRVNRLNNVGRTYYPMNWHPEVHCPNMMRFGNMSEPKLVCDGVNPFGDAARAGGVADSCLVYVFGHSNHWEFEADLLEQNPQCEVHVFSVVAAATPPPSTKGIYYHSFYLQLQDKEDNTSLSLASIKEKLGHDRKPIAIMKVG